MALFMLNTDTNFRVGSVLRTCGLTYRAGWTQAVTKFVVVSQEENVSRFTASHNTKHMSKAVTVRGFDHQNKEKRKQYLLFDSFYGCNMD